MSAIDTDSRSERWNRAVLGPLSSDFLRITTPRDIQEQADRQAALALYQQQTALSPYMPANIVGRLSITVAQAKLVKNYGMTRMDPYVRIRVGHFVYETQTDPNGGKNPRWNRVVHSQLPAGVASISLEIYDECSFTMDELIAWTEIKLPEAVLRGDTHEDWYPLSGKQGDGVEGMIDLVLSYQPASAHTPTTYMYQPVAPVVMVPSVTGRPMPVFVHPQQPQVVNSHYPHPQQPQPPPCTAPLTEEDLKQIQEMFPNTDREVIKSVWEANRGNKDRTINSLLQMTDQ
uniref:Protein that may be involved in binding ubiquitin-conjugating enzyme n=1 Tax=Nyssomyia neivai TaxID=330878 RepID=A0A1L8DTE9_9DIPT